MSVKRIVVAFGFWLLALVIGLLLISALGKFIQPEGVLWFIVINLLFLFIDSALIFLYIEIFRREISRYLIEGIKIGVFWTFLFIIIDVVIGVLIEGKPISYLKAAVPSYLIVFISGGIGGLVAIRRLAA